MTIPGTLTGVDTAFWLDQYWTSIFRALVQSPRINSPAFYIWMHLKQAALMLLYYTISTKKKIVLILCRPFKLASSPCIPRPRL